MERDDLYQVVTDTILAELERGVAPWVRPWKTLGSEHGGAAHNGYTSRAYRGINVLLLTVAALRHRYSDPRWFTYKQATLLGAHVRRGERSTRVMFWKQHRFEKTDAVTGATEERAVPVLRSYAVFNAEQCEGLGSPPPPVEVPADARYRAVGELFERHAVVVRHGGDRAYYAPVMDFIGMPKRGAFESEEFYWSTALHELSHWTAHPSRLARDLTGRFGSEAYAAEELVAEMGSAFLCAALGIEGRLHHPEYVGTWLKVLRGDKRAVFKAASLAQVAADFVLGRKDEACHVDDPSSATLDAEAKP